MQTPREKELIYIEKIKSKNPELFTYKERTEDGEFLEKFGIKIDNKKNLPEGLIKFLPSDFIVEEIDNENKLREIDMNSQDFQYEKDNPLKYISATLVKCGISTIDFENEIRKQIPEIQIGFGGIKDKKAITSQKITFKKEFYKEISEIKNPNFFLKDFDFCQAPINIGNLKGNKFTILVRFENLKEETIKTAEENIQKIKEIGFKNYFYMQRFGAPRFISQQLGYEILNGNFEKVVYKELFQTSDEEFKYIQNLRKESEKIAPDWQNIKKEYSNFPTILKTENDILDYLMENPNDFEGAVLSVKDQMQMWVYAFNSLMFNHLISSENNLEQTPLPLSLDRNIQSLYSKFFNQINFNPASFLKLKKYGFKIRNNYINTLVMPENLNYKFLEDKLIIQFELGKGSYATSMLSNIFNEKFGETPQTSDIEILDIKNILNAESENKDILELFKKTIIEN